MTPDKKLNVREVYINEYKYGEAFTRLQSLGKFREDCQEAGGKFSTEKLYTYTVGECRLPSVEYVMTEDISSNYERLKGDYSKVTYELREKLRDIFGRNNYGMTRVLAVGERPGGRYHPITVFGLSGMCGGSLCGVYFHKAKERKKKKKEAIEDVYGDAVIRVDNRPNIAYEAEMMNPVEKKLYLPTGYPFPQSLGSATIRFEPPIECAVRAYAEERYSNEYTPSEIYKTSGDDKDPDHFVVHSVRTDCYL